MKKLISIVLLFLLVLPFVATYTHLKVEKKQLRRSVKHKIIAGIEKEELVFLSFSKNDVEKMLEWEHSKEFKFRGEMYDVVTTEETNDSISFWCWWDNEETLLSQKLALTLCGLLPMNAESSKTIQNLADYSRSLYISTIKGLCPSDKVILLKDEYCEYKISYSSIYIEVPTPPPIHG